MTTRAPLYILAALASSGCFSYDIVKKTELPKMSNLAVGTVVSGPQTGNAVAVAVTHVERPDGRLLEVSGTPTVRIIASGKRHLFKHPIRARIEGDLLTVRSGNRPQTAFRLREVTQVAIRRPNLWNLFWSLTAGAAVGVLTGLLSRIRVATHWCRRRSTPRDAGPSCRAGKAGLER